eukprot:RCo043532
MIAQAEVESEEGIEKVGWGIPPLLFSGGVTGDSTDPSKGPRLEKVSTAGVGRVGEEGLCRPGAAAEPAAEGLLEVWGREEPTAETGHAAGGEGGVEEVELGARWG